MDANKVIFKTVSDLVLQNKQKIYASIYGFCEENLSKFDRIE